MNNNTDPPGSCEFGVGIGTLVSSLMLIGFYFASTIILRIPDSMAWSLAFMFNTLFALGWIIYAFKIRRDSKQIRGEE